MPKHDFLTAKAIGNRIKSKGLQKLRWYCQVCQKQCRDENGFKCHAQSESHQRQMLIVAQNPDKFIGGYSEMFESMFLENLKRRHGTKRVRSNIVYNEYIGDKGHIHMNATQWTTLSGFVQYLGRTGKCVVDETEKGWFIQYIDRDPRVLARQAELDKKKDAEMHHEELHRRFIEAQVEASSMQAGSSRVLLESQATPLERKDEDDKVKLTIGSSLAASKSSATKSIRDSSSSSSSSKLASSIPAFTSFQDRIEKGTKKETLDSKSIENGAGKEKKRKAAIDELMLEQEKRKQALVESERSKHRKENWITKDIVVKVMAKDVAEQRYYKKKGTIVDVSDKFIAHVKMLDSGDLLKIDQDDLETVLPNIDRRVKIVNGLGRSHIATLLALNVQEYHAKVRIETGSKRGLVLNQVEYEDISKLDEDAYAESQRE